MTDLKDQSVQIFLDQLASKTATPGGGGAAAIMGAQAAALISMVCNLTIGKPKYVEVDIEMQSLLRQSEALREQLTAMIKADADVFDCVMAAYGLAKTTETETAKRSMIIQEALKAATQVPLACARACADILKLSQIAAEKGNINVISDAGVAAMAAFGALKSAALNVYVNIGTLKDRDFAEACLAELEAVLLNAETTVEAVYQLVKSKL
ncbi:MAG: cyclodeaminase/cyclohydrolase family protein [Methylococcaceae bacterium]|nr:cyclodeaminase/cyclohydrolase family protein [Methylococcaceae bacterium]